MIAVARSAVKFRLVIVVVGLACSAPSLARAGQLGGDVPPNCVAHTSFGGGGDLADDYRCAGLAIHFHTSGVALSPFPIWAGQWLFTDEPGQFRVGSCTLNRGVHPTISEPSFVVGQAFPNDPTGGLGAYLSWRYGATTDNLTAAAMWAVFHFYAQDAAGTNRSASGSAPLVPSLDMVARASGRADVQQRAIELDAEARRFAAPWELTAEVTVAGDVRVSLRSGSEPVGGATVSVLVSGMDSPLTLTTDGDGSATSTVIPVPGRLAIAASASGPGGALVYRGTPAEPDPQGAQTLVTAGDPVVLQAVAAVDIAAPTTTTEPPPTTSTEPPATSTEPPPTTSTEPPATSTEPPATSTEPPATSTEPPATSTEPPPTTTEPSATTTEPPATTTEPPAATTEVPLGQSSLPTTGSSSEGIAYGATAALVAGVGLIGTVRRRAGLSG